MTDAKTASDKEKKDANLENSMALSSIKSIARASERMIKSLQEFNAGYPDSSKDESENHEPLFSVAEAAKLLGKNVSTVNKAEEAGKIPKLDRLPNGRKAKFTLSQVNAMREYWGCVPHRGPNTAPVKMSFQNFKGGVAKTTLSIHCAQYLATAGYRVLLIDADSQGSATMSVGLRPDVDIKTEHTLAPYLSEEADDLFYAIRETRWPGLDIIPASLGLYGAEYHLAAEAGTSSDEEVYSDEVDAEWIERLDEGIETVADNYDIIIIDPPPALGMISLSVLRAIDGLIIPTPPAMYDFYSTSSFFNMLEEVMETLVKTYGEELVEIEFVKILVSKKKNLDAHHFACKLIESTFGNNVLKTEFLDSAEINNAASNWKSVYDLDGPTKSRQTYKRCVANLDSVFAEVEQLIQTVWMARESKKMLKYGIPEVELGEEEAEAETEMA